MQYLIFKHALNPNAIYEKLQECGAKKDAVMLCYEPKGEFCHRYLLGRWLEEQLDVVVKEWE